MLARVSPTQPVPWRRIAVLAGIIVLGGLAYAAYRIWWTPLRGVPHGVGDPAPAFALTDQMGRPVSLESLVAGGAGIVVFYRAHW